MKTRPNIAFLLALVLLATLLPSCESLKNLAGSSTFKSLKEQAIELFRTAPLVFQTEIDGKPVRIVLREKKDGGTEQVAVTEDGQVLDTEAVKAAADSGK